MLIGILQSGHFPRAPGYDVGGYGDLYPQMLAGFGLDFRVWSVVDMDFPESVHAADGWLISGSRHGAYEDLPFIPPLEDFIRKAHAEKVPMVGICFGHQVIAKALGGKVEKFAGGWSVGRQHYDFGGQDVVLNAWHQDQVVEKPAEARVLASTPFCKYAALAYGDDILTVQPHPEYGDDALGLLLEVRAPGVVPDDRIAAARDGLGTPVDNRAMAERIATFFKEAAHG